MKKGVFPVILGITLIFATLSCSPRVITQTRLEYRDRHDTLMVRDSIREKEYVREFMKGDTVFVTSYVDRYVDRWRDRIVVSRDTVTIRDSVVVERRVEVERRLTPWQRFRLGMGNVLLLVLGLCLLWLIVRSHL